MKEESNAINCRPKLIPKWIIFIALGVGTVGAFFIPATSWVFYLWIILIILFVIKTLTQKPDINPILIIGQKGVKLSNTQFYPYSEIEKVMVFSKTKFKFRSLTFTLFLKNGAKVDFCVDDLDQKPQLLLDTINNNIKKSKVESKNPYLIS